jgi:hypothetical protein
MTPAEKLKAAAERLVAQQASVNAIVLPLLRTGHYDSCDFMLLDRDCTCPHHLARQVAILGALAPVITKQLHAAIDRMAEECLTELDYAPWHEQGCGLDVEPGKASGCACFADALALADAVLAATP